MKSIELTEEHKSKLLEMCKELFKEDSKINSIQNFRISNDYVLGLSDHILYCENRDLSESHYECEEVPEEDLITFENYPIECFEINIHWFEFCMTHLFNKLIVEKYGYMSISDAISNGYDVIHNQNPIDYLYSKFKN